MKRIFVLSLVSLLSSSVFAAPSQTPPHILALIAARASASLKHKVSFAPRSAHLKDDDGNGGSSPPNGNGSGGAYSVPVRKAAFKTTIQKNSWVKRSDGSYDFNTRDICTITTQINVYQGTDTNVNPDEAGLAVCDSTLNGQAVKVHVGGFVSLYHEPIFADEGATDFEAAFNSLYVENAPNSDNFLTSFSGTIGTGATATLGSLSANAFVSCEGNEDGSSTCTPSVDEYFGAITRIVDNP